MSWEAHVTWRQPAPAGTYADGTLVEHARSFWGYPDRESAWEAARAFAAQLANQGAVDIGRTVGTGGGAAQPIDPDRYRAWVAHVALLHAMATDWVRAAGGHDHRRGWELCPICGNPGDYWSCADPTCTVCHTGKTQVTPGSAA